MLFTAYHSTYVKKRKDLHKIKIDDLNEKDNKILFSILEEPKIPNALFLLAYPEVKERIEKAKKENKKIRLEDIYNNYSQYMTKRNFGHIPKLLSLNLIKERSKRTSKIEPYKINYFGFFSEIAYTCIYYIKRLDYLNSCIIGRNEKGLDSEQKEKLINEYKPIWRKEAETMAQKLSIFSIIGDRIIRDFYVAIYNKPPNYHIKEFIESIILALGQWPPDDFKNKLIEELIKSFRSLPVEELRKENVILSLKELQKYCYEYNRIKYKSNNSKMDNALFPSIEY